MKFDASRLEESLVPLCPLSASEVVYFLRDVERIEQRYNTEDAKETPQMLHHRTRRILNFGDSL